GKAVVVGGLLVCISASFVLARIAANHHVSGSASSDALAHRPLEKIKAILDSQLFRNQTEFLDYVMELTNRYTVHLTDDWHNRNWHIENVVLAHFYRAMIGDEKARPHASCGPRCMIMAWILQSYGIPNRQIAIFSSSYQERIVGHQQIEILNADSGR